MISVDVIFLSVLSTYTSVCYLDKYMKIELTNLLIIQHCTCTEIFFD